jgi:hypothetical protein
MACMMHKRKTKTWTVIDTVATGVLSVGLALGIICAFILIDLMQ